MKPGRNDLCPCGSGRKYKKCCEAEAAPVVPDRLLAEATREPQQGGLERAAQLRANLVATDPAEHAALHLMGTLAAQDGRSGQAAELFRRVVGIDPSNAAAHLNLGLALYVEGPSQEGLSHLRKAVELAPESEEVAERSFRVLCESKSWTEAISYGLRWVAIAPDNAFAHRVLGDCFFKLERREEAGAHYRKALELEPDWVDAANNLGACLAGEGHLHEALDFYQRAVDLKPNDANAWANLGSAVLALGRPELGLQCQDMALTLEPSRHDSPWNRALCLLGLGRLPEGWSAYEGRWDAGVAVRGPRFSQPRWEGSDPAGKTILVYMEQGLGDEILFASMLPDLVRSGAHCIVACDPRLVQLFARSFAGAEVLPHPNPRPTQWHLPGVDFQIPGGSLARWLRPNIESFPRSTGYLIPDPALAYHWKERMDALGDGLKVGICWRSMVTVGDRWIQYSRLNQWGPILTTPGVHFLNLQYSQCAEELREAEAMFDMRIHEWGDIDLKDDQEGVAALISELDLVISAGTAVAEMAGALGIPTWVLSKNGGDWSCLGQSYNPWHRGTRYFYCGDDNPWEPVIERAGASLHQSLSDAGGSFVERTWGKCLGGPAEGIKPA